MVTSSHHPTLLACYFLMDQYPLAAFWWLSVNHRHGGGVLVVLLCPLLGKLSFFISGSIQGITQHRCQK